MTNTKPKRGLKKAVIMYDVYVGTDPIAVDLMDCRKQVGEHLASIKDKSTWAQMAARVDCDGVTGTFLAGLVRETGKLTVERYLAIRDVFGWQDHEVLLSEEQRTMLETNAKVVQLATVIGGKQIDWSSLIGELHDAACLSDVDALASYKAVHGNTASAKDLVLGTISSLMVSSDLATAASKPPLEAFFKAIGGPASLQLAAALERWQSQQIKQISQTA